MPGIISLLVILVLSILITRVATLALIHTGLSRESARFQARSAFTGVGFTTDEAEKVVNHPVRRRILMLLMLLGNAGVVSAISSLILTFVKTGQQDEWIWELILLVTGLAALLTAAHSSWLDRHLSKVISKALARWTRLNVRDYVGLLRLGSDYQIVEMEVDEDDWLAEKSLSQLRLRDEGIMILGIQRSGGEYVGAPNGETVIHTGDTLLMYGRSTTQEQLDERREGMRGEQEHQEAVEDQDRVAQQERAQDEDREKARQSQR